MATLDYHKNLIYERIDKATSINDLISMLQFMDLKIIKNQIKSQIETITLNERSNLFYSSLSIETILPMDIIQHIASFNNFANIQSVSNIFNKCYKKNENIKSKERQQEFISIIQKHKLNENENKQNETWVVDKKRTKLNDKEIQLKYKGPINNLVDAINGAESGDTILIYDGKYGNFDDILDFNKALQIIGCGDNVLIKYDGSRISNDIYFKNIKIKTDEWIVITNKCGLFVENCDMMLAGYGIVVTDGSVLSVANCNFYGNFNDTLQLSNEAINIQTHAKEVTVIGCMFSEFGRSAEGFDCIHLDDDPKVKLKCVNNLFKNNHNPPISRIFVSDAILQDNKVKYDGDVLEFLNCN